MSIRGSDEIAGKIAKCRRKIEELETFFREADAKIAGDPDDPREGIGMLPGLERVRLLTPCILDRLEADIRAGRIEFDSRTIRNIVDGIEILAGALKAVQVYYDEGDRVQASDLMTHSYRCAMKNLKMPVDRHPGRLFKDAGRLARDFQGLGELFRGFEENRKREPMTPEGDRKDSIDAWFDYYVEKARLEDPLFDCVESGEMSESCLREGYRRTVEQSKEQDRNNTRVMRSYRWYESRDEAFDPEHPEAFLDADRIPFKEIHAEVTELGEGITMIRLPPDDSDTDSSKGETEHPDEEFKTDSKSGDEPDFRHDPAYLILDRFTTDLMCACRMDEPPEDMENPDLPQVLRNYVVLLALKPQVRIGSCHVNVETAESDAPRFAVYRFASHCLKRIAEAIEKLGGRDLLPNAARARRARREIEEVCKGN